MVPAVSCAPASPTRSRSASRASRSDRVSTPLRVCSAQCDTVRSTGSRSMTTNCARRSRSAARPARKRVEEGVRARFGGERPTGAVRAPTLRRRHREMASVPARRPAQVAVEPVRTLHVLAQREASGRWHHRTHRRVSFEISEQRGRPAPLDADDHQIGLGTSAGGGHRGCSDRAAADGAHDVLHAPRSYRCARNLTLSGCQVLVKWLPRASVRWKNVASIQRSGRIRRSPNRDRGGRPRYGE